jgi:drug/metabolite transporter (DMT)-like permease
VLGIALLAPEEAGAYGTASTTTYAFAAFGIAILATGLLHLLLLLMPRPISFFNWIMMLATAVAVLLPFTLAAELDSQIATAAINLVIGLCIISLLNSVAASATRATGGSAAPGL